MKTERVHLTTKLAYGFGQMAEAVKNISFELFAVFLYYNNQVLGLSGSLVGLALLIALCVDGLTDPLIGYLSDGWRSRWGRRHPWMYLAALPLALSFYLLFSSPGKEWFRGEAGFQRRAQRFQNTAFQNSVCCNPALCGDARRPINSKPARSHLSLGTDSKFRASVWRLLWACWWGSPWRGPNRPRVFVMGAPGTGQGGTLDDLNAEKKYASMKVHMNAVAGNEALVHVAARRYPGAAFFGLNPGLIKTNIRANVLGGQGSLRFKAVESLIGFFTPTAEDYADRMVPLLLSPELEAHSGTLFNAKGLPIERSDGMTQEHAERMIAASEALIDRGRRAS